MTETVLESWNDGSARGAEKSLAKAKELGWTVVSMKDDWKTVFTKEGPHE